MGHADWYICRFLSSCQELWRLWDFALPASQQVNLLRSNGCRLRLLSQRQRTSLLRPCRVAYVSCSDWFSFILTSHGSVMEQPGWMLCIVTEESNPSCKRTCPVFAWEGDTLYKNPWKDSLEWKLSVAGASAQVQRCAETHTHGKLSTSMITSSSPILSKKRFIG